MSMKKHSAIILGLCVGLCFAGLNGYYNGMDSSELDRTLSTLTIISATALSLLLTYIGISASKETAINSNNTTATIYLSKIVSFNFIGCIITYLFKTSFTLENQLEVKIASVVCCLLYGILIATVILTYRLMRNALEEVTD